MKKPRHARLLVLFPVVFFAGWAALILFMAGPDLLRAAPTATAQGYDRDLFRHWIDLDGDCQDARDEALLVEDPEARLSPDGCRVSYVVIVDPYDGQTYAGPARALDIDHIVPLAEAWASGADRWEAAEREAFANDPSNLVPTRARWNRRKGARDPAGWVPPNPGTRCWYGRQWFAVKAEYRLSMDGAEVAAIAGLLATCGVPP